MRTGLISFFLFLVFITPAQAETSHALAMHGTPKYAEDFQHLDYVNPDAAKGGVLRSAVIGSFDSLNHSIIRGTEAEALHLINDSLMQRVWDEPFTLYGLVAEHIEIPDDRSWITFHMRETARFHDGHPMTAEDVKFSFEMLKKHGYPVRRRVYGLVNQIDVIDDKTIRFTFGEGYDRETALIVAIMPVLPKHYWEGRKFEETTLEPPLGSGPYRIGKVEQGRRITYERVADYWAKDLPINTGQYNFDEIIYDYYRDEDVAFEAFKAGTLNYRREHNPVRWKTSYNFPALKSGDVKKEMLAHSRPEWARSLIFNTRRFPFNDRRVRKALSYAFDFEWINKSLFHGVYKRNKSFFPNSELAAQDKPTELELTLLNPLREDLPPEVFGTAFEPPTTSGSGAAGLRDNLRTATTLLKESGWEIKENRLTHIETGKPFIFEILLRSVTDEKLALAFARNLRKLGITANVRNVDSAQYAGRLESFDFDMTLYRWINSLSPGAEQIAYWGEAAADSPGGRNYAGIKNPAIEALAAKLAQAKDRQTLVAAARTLDRALSWGYYTIPLYHIGGDLVAYDSQLAHPQEIPLYGLVLETWWHQ